MTQDRAAEIAEKIWQDYEADIIGQPFELIAAIAAALTAAREEGRRAGIEEAAVYLLGKAAGSHSREERHAFAIRALAGKERRL